MINHDYCVKFDVKRNGDSVPSEQLVFRATENNTIQLPDTVKMQPATRSSPHWYIDGVAVVNRVLKPEELKDLAFRER